MQERWGDAEMGLATAATNCMAEHKVGQRRIIATPVLASYWRLACERQRVYFKRLAGRARPGLVIRSSSGTGSRTPTEPLTGCPRP